MGRGKWGRKVECQNREGLLRHQQQRPKKLKKKKKKLSPCGVLVCLRAAVPVLEFPVGPVRGGVVSLADVWQEVGGAVVALAVCCWKGKEGKEREGEKE